MEGVALNCNSSPSPPPPKKIKKLHTQKELYGNMIAALSNTVPEKNNHLTDVLQNYRHRSLGLKSEHERIQNQFYASCKHCRRTFAQ